MNSQASKSRVAMQRIVFTVSKNHMGEDTEFKRNYLNFKIDSVDSNMISKIIQNPNISAAGPHSESLELLSLSSHNDETLSRWIQTFTNLERLKIDDCHFLKKAKIQISKKLKILVSSDDDLRVIILYLRKLNIFINLLLHKI